MSDEKKLPEQRAWSWWRQMQDFFDRDKNPNPKADRASLAKLRRATPESVVGEPAFHALYSLLYPGHGYGSKQCELATRLALVLPYVREDKRRDDSNYEVSFARQLGNRLNPDTDEKEASKRPHLKFRRLLAMRDENEIIREFRRMVGLLDGKVNLPDLALLLLNWDQEDTRTRFAFGYFGNTRHAPKQDVHANAQQ